MVHRDDTSTAQGLRVRMSRVPIYSLDVERAPPFSYDGRGNGARDGDGDRDRRRDPKARRACIPPTKVPIYRVVLRKDGTLRVPRTSIDTPAEAHAVAYALIGDRPFEHLVTLFLNAQNDITGAIIVATTGNVSSASSSVRGIFTGALVHNAVGIILAHNHPSGNPEPSADDIAMTEKIRVAGSVLGVPVLDHLIITRDPTRWRSIMCHAS